MTKAEIKAALHTVFRPINFGVFGFFFIPTLVGILTGAYSQKWIVLGTFGAFGLTLMVCSFMTKWQNAPPVQRLILMGALFFGFFTIQTMVLTQ